MYESILVPTDGSEGSEAAIDRAIDIAETYDAALHTLYVVERPDGAEGVVAGSVFEGLQEMGHRAIRTVISRAGDREVRTVEGSVAEGVPHRAILQYTDEHDIDLIVMGTHGRTGLGRYMIGSVTEKVVRLSDVPVLTVPLGEHREEEGEGLEEEEEHREEEGEGLEEEEEHREEEEEGLEEEEKHREEEGEGLKEEEEHREEEREGLEGEE